jgi:hypothetical protein
MTEKWSFTRENGFARSLMETVYCFGKMD